MSVGDLWANDLAAPAGRGCATAYVDRFGLRQGPADARALVQALAAQHPEAAAGARDRLLEVIGAALVEPD